MVHLWSTSADTPFTHPFAAEATSFLLASSQAQKMNFNQIIVERDWQVVVKALTSDAQSNSLDNRQNCRRNQVQLFTTIC